MAKSRSRRTCSAARPRGQGTLRVEALEARIVPAGFSLAPDIATVMLPADATAFPTCDVDVLANDSGTNLRLVSLGQPALGTVERVVGAGEGGRDLIRYLPGPTFRGRDAFVYTAIDDEGAEAS
ncbi:MAG: Ig-like domain-containing protein, partial [Planctomycetaceae bacterium]